MTKDNDSEGLYQFLSIMDSFSGANGKIIQDSENRRFLIHVEKDGVNIEIPIKLSNIPPSIKFNVDLPDYVTNHTKQHQLSVNDEGQGVLDLVFFGSKRKDARAFKKSLVQYILNRHQELEIKSDNNVVKITGEMANLSKLPEALSEKTTQQYLETCQKNTLDKNLSNSTTEEADVVFLKP